jgi:hypothetical protein
VAARFVGNPEIAAGLSPAGAVRRDAASAAAKLSKEMGQLVTKSAIDFGGAMIAQKRIQRDQVAARIGAAGGAGKARIPFHADFPGEVISAEWGEDFARLRFETRIASKHDE